MNKLLFKLIIFLPIVCFFLFPRQIAFATNYWAPVTVGVSTPGGTPIANVKLDFDTSSTATYTGSNQLRQCTSEAFIQKIASGYQYLKDLTFPTGADGKVTWNGVDDYGFACSCNDMRVVINLPEGYVVAGLYDGANNPFTYYGGTAPGGTASTFITTSNNTRSSIYWRVKPQSVPPTTSTLPPTTSTLPPTTSTVPPTTSTLPPTTTTLPQCGSPCTANQQCVYLNLGCNYCVGGVCTSTPPASCTCDGIAYTGLISGQPVTITSFSKIVGDDVNNAKVVSEKFHFINATDPTNALKIAESGDIASTLIQNSSSSAEYQTQWTFTLPQLVTGATYRIWSDIDCQPKTVAFNYSGSSKKVVLGAEKKASFLDNFFGFFANLSKFFGGGLNNNSTLNAVNAVATPTPTSVPGKKTLQLGTLKQATVIEKACSTIIFRQD